MTKQRPLTPSVGRCLLLLPWLLLMTQRTVWGLDPCTDPWLDYAGYTFVVDPVTGEKIWSHCDFPNPKADHERCGMSETDGVHFVCDPDLLIDSLADRLDSALVSIQTNTSTLCTNQGGNSESFIVAVALVDRIRVPNFQDASLCINNCGEIQPTLDTSTRAPTDEELNAVMANFANGLRTTWNLGSCDNDVVVFYSKQYNTIYTSVGSKASTILSSASVSRMEQAFLTAVRTGNIDAALLGIAEELRVALRGWTPAHIVLTLNMILLVLTVLFLLFFLNLNTLDLNVWGKEKHWRIVENIMYALSGVWIINGVMLAVIIMSNKAPFWAVGVGVVCAVACGVMVIVGDTYMSTASYGTPNYTYPFAY